MGTLPAAPGTPHRKHWDLFCRVVDNLGDAAVLWRLARQLSIEHGCSVRLFIDQPAVLQRLVPGAKPGRVSDGVLVCALLDGTANDSALDSRAADGSAADVVVSGFHAALPLSYRRRLAPRGQVWINLEYLSAEDWTETFHCLPSTHPDGLVEHYFYPGFTTGSGGLLREGDLMARRDEFQQAPENRRRFLDQLGVLPRDDETLASLLCYPSAPLAELAHCLASCDRTLHLMVPEGVATDACDAGRLHAASRGRLRISRIPFLAQIDFDQLLWSCDLNFVRGEDSWVRAIWANRPFVWQIYPQAEEAHLPKLEAFLRLLKPGPMSDAIRWWNRAPGGRAMALPDIIANPQLDSAGSDLCARQARLPGLAGNLREFADNRREKNRAAVSSARQL